ncbi:MAG: OmpA family protein [Saprospiraceae bacterium]|nr:OmpA family protein [Saprospiraceae bacterium]
MKKILFLFLGLSLLSSCVSKKKFIDLQAERDSIRMSHSKLEEDLKECERSKTSFRTDLEMRGNQLSAREAELAAERSRAKSLEDQINNLQVTNKNLLDRLSDLSVISKSGAESIQKSLEAINQQNTYIKDLTGTIQRKDSLNLALVMNLKRSLADVNDEDVNIEVRKGVVYISLSDKMLFNSGSYIIKPAAETVLGKIAKVVNDHNELDILVEGHTDTVPIKTEFIKDNWDLSALRATSVVRLLQWKYNVKPERMTAGGRSQFVPNDTNATDQGKSKNRRTEIIILPKLDQFFQLLEPNAGGKK